MGPLGLLLLQLTGAPLVIWLTAPSQLRFHTCTAKDRVERFIAITLNVNVAYKVAVDKYGRSRTLSRLCPRFFGVRYETVRVRS